MATQEKKLEALQLIGTRPGLRTVQLSDLLDLDIGDIKKILAEHANASTIDVHDVIAPNGEKANAYTLAGVALPSEMQRGEVPADPVAEVAAKPEGTKVDRAVAFIIAEGGKVSAGAMHSMLGLKPDQYPSQYLNDGILKGRLYRNPHTKEWSLGVNEPAFAPKKTYNNTINKKKNTGPKAQFDHKAPLDYTPQDGEPNGCTDGGWSPPPRVGEVEIASYSSKSPQADQVFCIGGGGSGSARGENLGGQRGSFTVGPSSSVVAADGSVTHVYDIHGAGGGGGCANVGKVDVYEGVTVVSHPNGSTTVTGGSASFPKTPEIFPFPKTFKATFKLSPDQAGALKAVFDSLTPPGEMPAEMVIGGEVVARGTVMMPIDQLFDDLEKVEDFTHKAVSSAAPKQYGLGGSELDKELRAIGRSEMLQAADSAFSPGGPGYFRSDLANDIASDWHRAKSIVQSYPVKVDHEETTFAIWSNGDLQIAVNGRVTQTIAAADVDALRDYLTLFPSSFCSQEQKA